MPYDIDSEIMNNRRSVSNVRPRMLYPHHTTHSVQAPDAHSHRPAHPTLYGELPTWRDHHVAQLRGAMSPNGHAFTENILPGTVPLAPLPPTSYTPIEWDWDVEHADRRREARADAAHDAQPFLVDRRVLKDIVREKTHCEVGRITFLSSGKLLRLPLSGQLLNSPATGTFHKVGGD